MVKQRLLIWLHILLINVWVPEVRNIADTSNPPWVLPLSRGNTHGGFGVLAVLPTSRTHTFIKSYNFLFHGGYAVAILNILFSSTLMLATAIKNAVNSCYLLEAHNMNSHNRVFLSR